MSINSPNQILNAVSYAVSTAVNTYYKNGVQLEKGVIITTKRIEKNRLFYERLNQFFSCYPDLFIDLITPSYNKRKLYFYQRYFLRLCMRHERILVIAPRAFSKTFISILAMYLMCMFRPHIKLFICAPGKSQSAKIAREKIFEIWDWYPLLKKEIVGEGNFGGDYV